MTNEQVVINMKARAYLTSTDWYVTRWLERGIPIPEEISQKREDARNRIVG
jgi:hypothetical protein